MNKLIYLPVMLALVLMFNLTACGKADEEATQQDQLKMQADKARMDLQEKADALARNPPPELIQAAKEAAAKEAAKGQ